MISDLIAVKTEVGDEAISESEIIWQVARLCLGYAVARAELEIGLEVLTRRLTDVRLGEIEIEPSGVIAGPERIDVSYRPRA